MQFAKLQSESLPFQSVKIFIKNYLLCSFSESVWQENDQIETIFFIARPEYSFLSSTTVKEIAFNGGDISEFIPAPIVERVENKLNK